MVFALPAMFLVTALPWYDEQGNCNSRDDEGQKPAARHVAVDILRRLRSASDAIAGRNGYTTASNVEIDVERMFRRCQMLQYTRKARVGPWDPGIPRPGCPVSGYSTR